MTLMETVLADLPTTRCLAWPGYRDPRGYGKAKNPRTHQVCYAHRVVYETVVGPIADGLYLDHLCRNRVCVNPAHMEPVTNGENQRRGFQATKTVCVNGHPYDEANSYRRPDGRRDCRACNRERQRRMKKRREVAA
jgi:hypothetical protein